jgi:hypothetical protein
MPLLPQHRVGEGASKTEEFTLEALLQTLNLRDENKHRKSEKSSFALIEASRLELLSTQTPAAHADCL